MATMDFNEQIFELSRRSEKLHSQLQTEEATKHSLVLPFIKALGYDVFNPLEVVPEFTADVGTKKGEKVDYALFKDGSAIMLFECKQVGGDLAKAGNQLYRYFSVTEARIGVLTDGLRYLFFTDLDEPNKMDAKPFMELDLANIDEALLPELRKFSRKAFDMAQSLSCASDLKFVREIKKLLAAEMSSPSEEFLKYVLSKIYAGRKTAAFKEQFAETVKRALAHFIDERINERLKSAMVKPEEMPAPPEPSLEPQGDKIVTTPEELEGFYIVKSIVRRAVDPARVFDRDAQSYFSVLLDDNNRKPICRLRFNHAKKYIGLFPEGKEEVKEPLESLNDIFKFESQLLAAVNRYETGGA
jgi:hypothetical protein